MKKKIKKTLKNKTNTRKPQKYKKLSSLQSCAAEQREKDCSIAAAVVNRSIDQRDVWGRMYVGMERRACAAKANVIDCKLKKLG